jgi:hypothetical protein
MACSITLIRKMEYRMKRLCTSVFALTLSWPLLALAQQTADAPTASIEAAAVEAQQFDFLLGQWELDVHPKVGGLVAMIHGTPRLLGTWKAWRTPDGLGIDDELRIVDASGNPISSNRSHRTYVAAERHWAISGGDASRGRSSMATGLWRNGEMHMEGRSSEAQGASMLIRTRYYDIRKDGFRMQQDRSTDDGKSWDEGVLTIDARRVAATATP